MIKKSNSSHDTSSIQKNVKKRKKEKKRKEKSGEKVDEEIFYPHDEVKMEHTRDNLAELAWVDHTFLTKHARGASVEEVHRRIYYLKFRKR